MEPNGEPSLQNAVEMARSSMSHLPTHSSREVVVIYGSLTTCDPGNIHDTLDECVKDRIRISIVALAAEMKICRDLCEKTGGTSYRPQHWGMIPRIFREIWRSNERGPLQRPSIRAHPSACTTRRDTNRRWHCGSGPHDHGLPYAPTGHLSSVIVCVSLANEERGLLMSALPGQGMRRPHRLRHLRPHDRQFAAPGAKLSPPLSREALYCNVSTHSDYVPCIFVNPGASL